MKRTWALGLACLTAVALAAGCKSSSSTEVGSTEPVSIISHAGSGNDPAFKQPADPVILITTREQLDRTGSETLAKVEIDFNTQSLVVLALGEEPTAGYWARITGIQRKGSELYVQGLANKPEGEAAAVLTYPIDAVIVPRQDGITEISPEIEAVTGQTPPESSQAPSVAPATN